MKCIEQTKQLKKTCKVEGIKLTSRLTIMQEQQCGTGITAGIHIGGTEQRSTEIDP